MKHFTLVSIVCALVLSLSSGICIAQETADEVLNKVKKACDPQDKCKSINTMVTTAKVKTFDGKEGELIVELKKPGKVRIEVKGTDFAILKLCDGKKAWDFSTKDGLRELTGKELEMLRFQALYLAPDSNLKEIFPKTTLEGDAEFAGGKCYKLKCEAAPEFSSEPYIMYVDKKTCLVVKSEEKHIIKDQTIEITTVYENYEDVDGIVVPMTIISEFDNKIREVKIDSVKWDEDLPDSDFEPPKTLGN